MGKSSDRDVAGDWNGMSLCYENKDVDRLPGHCSSDVRSSSASRRHSLAYRFFRVQASCPPNPSDRAPFRAEYFRRDSARDPRRQSTTAAKSARAGKIRTGGRKCLARSRGPRKRERNQLLQYFFLATVPLSPTSGHVES